MDVVANPAGPSRSVDAASMTKRYRFSLGGVALELLPEPSFAWALPAETRQHTRENNAAPTLAAVTCSVRVDPWLEPLRVGSPASVRWERTSDGVCVRSPQVLLDIATLGPRRFIVAARMGDPALLTVMLNTLVTSVAELAGGLCLHATAVAHAAGAVLLLGPSGAGKSTAAGLLGDDVTCLSNDRVNLVPDPIIPGRFWAWSLPIGAAPALQPSAAVTLPLAALLRVIQASEPKVAAVREIEALLHIRQAVEVGVGSEFFEAQRLCAVAALAAAAKSGVAHVSLTPSWRTHLDAFLGADSASRACAQNSSARVDGAGT
jgi:hypothetical protein